MSVIKATAERNFRRAKVRPGKRKPSVVRRLSWRLVRLGLAATVIAYASYRATTLVLHASVLQVRHINVHGNVRVSSGEVRAIIDSLRGSSILTANLAHFRRRLMQSPWIADAALSRVLPSTVEVFISERTPIGLCRLGNDVYLIDAHGIVIDQFGPQYAEFDLPIVDGLVRAPHTGQPAIDEERAELAARVLEAIASDDKLAKRVSQIDVRDAHDALVLLQNDSALLHLGDDRFLERLRAYVDLAPALRDRVPDIDYVDLRFEDRVYVRPAAMKTR